MKFGICYLRKVENTKAGDMVCFEMPSGNYVITAIETTAIGMIRHQHNGGSSSYWPGELVYVQDESERAKIGA